MEPSGEHDAPVDAFDAADPVAIGVATAPVGVEFESVELETLLVTVAVGGSAATVTISVPVEVTTTVLVEVPLATGVASAAAATVTIGGSEISLIPKNKIPEEEVEFEEELESAATAESLPVVVRFWLLLTGQPVSSVGGPVFPPLKAPPNWIEGPGFG